MILDFFIYAASVAAVAGGAVFFMAGTVGMLRFPDVYTRLHAMTKADNLGMGLVALGLVLVAPGWAEAFKLVLTWGFILIAGTTAAHLVAHAARREGVEAVEAGPEVHEER